MWRGSPHRDRRGGRPGFEAGSSVTDAWPSSICPSRTHSLPNEDGDDPFDRQTERSTTTMRCGPSSCRRPPVPVALRLRSARAPVRGGGRRGPLAWRACCLRALGRPGGTSDPGAGPDGGEADLLPRLRGGITFASESAHACRSGDSHPSGCAGSRAVPTFRYVLRRAQDSPGSQAPTRHVLVWKRAKRDRAIRQDRRAPHEGGQDARGRARSNGGEDRARARSGVGWEVRWRDVLSPTFTRRSSAGGLDRDRGLRGVPIVRRAAEPLRGIAESDYDERDRARLRGLARHRPPRDQGEPRSVRGIGPR